MDRFKISICKHKELFLKVIVSKSITIDSTIPTRFAPPKPRIWKSIKQDKEIEIFYKC
jgi:hypothetical protein